MKYRCLILDHDDTAVNSTPYLHYPAHIEVMKELRPGKPPISLKGWMLKNFSPGIMEYMVNELYFTPDEIKREYEIWQDFVVDKQVSFFPGFIELMREYHEAGGIITVVSHSTKEKIMQDYASVGAKNLVQAAFGWDFDETKRKPDPYPVLQILEQFKLSPEDVLVIDDLKPAITMARKAGVAIGAAGWGILVPEIADYMKKHSDFYFRTIDDIRELLFAVKSSSGSL
ncbi:MAG: HAD family hydrolase [Spirochaetales bacterium]|nr:HAD family hydrolase [Spirochaetales bacterium]